MQTGKLFTYLTQKQHYKGILIPSRSLVQCKLNQIKLEKYKKGGLIQEKKTYEEITQICRNYSMQTEHRLDLKFLT